MIFKTKGSGYEHPATVDLDNMPDMVSMRYWANDRKLDFRYFNATDDDDYEFNRDEYDFIKIYTWYIPPHMKELIVEFKLTFGDYIIN